MTELVYTGEVCYLGVFHLSLNSIDVNNNVIYTNSPIIIYETGQFEISEPMAALIASGDLSDIGKTTNVNKLESTVYIKGTWVRFSVTDEVYRRIVKEMME